MISNFRKVVDGLYRGSGPTPQDVAKLKEKFGINKIVSLDQHAGDRIDRVCKMLKIKHIMVPINTQNPAKSLLNLFSYDIKKLLLDDGPTFVHCIHGSDRTGLLIAILKCKYFGKNPQEAIEEAKSLGFGLGIPAQEDNLFEKIIKSCKPVQDINSADIVSNEREYLGDNRDTYLDESKQQSFAPYLDIIREYPFDYLYQEQDEQSPTRENYLRKLKLQNDPKSTIPEVGQYDNSAGLYGTGPVFPTGGFISE